MKLCKENKTKNTESQATQALTQPITPQCCFPCNGATDAQLLVFVGQLFVGTKGYPCPLEITGLIHNFFVCYYYCVCVCEREREREIERDLYLFFSFCSPCTHNTHVHRIMQEIQF